jgi:hypothetical protein
MERDILIRENEAEREKMKKERARKSEKREILITPIVKT